MLHRPAHAEDVRRLDHHRVDVLDTPIDRVDMAATVARCQVAVSGGPPVQHMAVNAAKLVALRQDTALREAVANSELVTADGQAVVWASRLLGDPLPSRVAGIDLMWELFALAEREGHRVYVLGAKREVLDIAIERIRTRYPGIVLAGYRDGYFSEDEADAVAADIAETQPAMLFVAMSSPRKELFLARHRERIGAGLVMGVGGSIDVAAGITRRAPLVMQRAGLEWLFRLLQEPRRLFRRYLVTNTRFTLLVLSVAARARAQRLKWRLRSDDTRADA